MLNLNFTNRQNKTFDVKQLKYCLMIVFLTGVVSQAAAIDLNSSTSLRYFPDSGEKEFAVTPEGNLNITGDNITNFFDQGQCADDEAIKTIYPNGSYVCNSISTTTAAEGLAETLETNNTAGENSIDLRDNSINNIYSLSGSDGRIRLNDDLDIGDNQLIVGGSNISGGLRIGSDLDLRGNNIEQVGVLNPGGSSTNFGGNLNVGLNRITSTDNIEFSRGIEIGNSETFTGSRTVDSANNFTVDTFGEWNQGTKNQVSIVSNSLQLTRSDDTAEVEFNQSLSSGGNGLTVENGNIYVLSGGNLKKYDSTGTEVWSQSLSNSGESIHAAGTSVYIGSGTELVKYEDNGGSVSETWATDTGYTVEAITEENGNIYIATSNFTAKKYVDSGENVTEKWSASLGSDSGNPSNTFGITSQESNIYAGAQRDLFKFDSQGNQVWQTSVDNVIQDVGIEEDTIYTAQGGPSGTFDGAGPLGAYTDNGGSVTEKWTQGTPYPIYSLDVQDGSIYASGGRFGNGFIAKYVDEGSSASEKWLRDLSGQARGIGLDDNFVYTSTQADDRLLKFENIVTYSNQGTYNSTMFDAGNVQPFPEFQTSAFLPEDTDANVTVSLSNNSDMSNSVSEKLEIGGGTESQIIDRNARYAQFTVNMSGDTTDTPELDQVSIDYGNTAAAYGYNQIALGQGATTDAEGAVAIGYNASSSEEYLARFGNNQGQELSAEVTGNLTVDGELKGVDIPEDTGTENLSETLEAGNTANQSINLSGNNVTDADTVESEEVETQKVSLGDGMSMQRKGDNLVISD